MYNIILSRLILENDNKDKIVVGLVSIWAGGGHIALMDFLFEELKDDKRFTPYTYIHNDSSFDRINDMLLGKMGPLIDVFYKNLPNEYMSVSALKLVEECEKFIKKYNPDIVIGTNWGITGAFGLVKKSLKLNFINVLAIPDYGIPSMAGFPNNHYTRPDYALVFDPEAKTGLIKERKFPAEKIIVSGYLTKKSTRQLVKIWRKKSKAELVKAIQEDIGKNYSRNISPNKRTILIAGGAGGIIGKSYDLLKMITEYQESHPEFIQNNQFLIITGKTTKYFDKIFKHQRKKEENWSNIIPIPWIEHETYAKIQLLADFPILTTIAPASMNELIEASCGPIVVYKHRRGQEWPHVRFIAKNGLGYYIPKKQDLLNVLLRGFSEIEKDRFLKNATKYHDRQAKEMVNLPDDIFSLASKSISSKRKSDKNRIKLNINFNLISPKVWLSILVLMIPSSILFGFVQYKKGSSKISNNKYTKMFMSLLSKLNPFSTNAEEETR